MKVCSEVDGACVFAPGRINLIGDHIDYVGGTVLPMSVDRGTWFAFEAIAEPVVELHALDRGERLRLAPADVRAAPHPVADDEDWHRFLRGLIALGPGGDAGAGARIAVAGELRGGGLSSSASFCVGLGRVLVETGVLAAQTPLELAHLARAVEHRFVGVACGLMDQLSVALGRDDGAMVLDCGREDFRALPLSWGARTMLVMRASADRQLASGGYNARRSELAAGLERLGVAQDSVPPANTLPDHIDAADVPLRRVRHVVTEQARVQAAIAAAQAQDWSRFGAAMTASHASLRDDYAVSTPEQDAIVAAACAVDGCDGARLTGAGFGGWTIALVDAGVVDEVLSATSAALGRTLAANEWFVARPGGAVRTMEAVDA